MDMKHAARLPWIDINNYLLETGCIRDPKIFAKKAVENLYSLVPFDQARIFFFNTSGKIQDVIVLGTNEEWITEYLEYYSKIEDGKYSVARKVDSSDKKIRAMDMNIRDWSKQYDDEFLKDYIKPQGIMYSAGFRLHANDDFTKCVYALDRLEPSGFTQEEVDVMKVIYPHLNNLYRNMHLTPSTNNEGKLKELEMILSKREIEISGYLCAGLSPGLISEKLFISRTTIYRHIANIHSKLKVTSRQELILKLVRFGISPEV